MPAEPLISVCMPVFNAAPFLREAIEGVLGQTYGRLELVICDNLSTDGSFEIAREYAEKDERIRLVRNRRNIGFAGNLHKVTSLAQGDFMMVHCADDTAEPLALERIVSLVTRSDIDPDRTLFLTDAYMIDGVGQRTGIITRRPDGFDNLETDLASYHPTGRVDHFDGHDAMSYALQRLRTVGFLGAIVYPRSLFESIEGVYNGLLYSPDKEYMYSLLSTDPQVLWLREPLFSWRIHEGGQGPQERNMAVIRQALDAYTLTFRYGDDLLARYGTSRVALRGPFLEDYCLRRALQALRDGDRLLSLRYICFALATYPREARRSLKFYAVLVGYLIGPLGPRLAGWAHRRGWWKQPASASAGGGRSAELLDPTDLR